MSVYNVGVCSTYEGRKCGKLSGWIKLKGIHFILKKVPQLNTKNYTRIIIANLIC